MNLTVEIPVKIRVTEREGEVLNLLSKGMSRKEIASLMHITPGTTKQYISSLLFKLSASNATELVANAFRMGIME